MTDNGEMTEEMILKAKQAESQKLTGKKVRVRGGQGRPRGIWCRYGGVCDVVCVTLCV